MHIYEHALALRGLRDSIAAIQNEGRHPLRDYSRPIRARNGGMTGPYYFIPQPLIIDRATMPEGFGGYLSADGRLINEGSFVRLRITRADDIVSLRHTGWYADDDNDSGNAMFGVVARLPRSRGFLAGWSLGESMATSFGRFIFRDEREAARAADREAELAAEHERDYQRAERAREAEDSARADS